MKLWLQNALFLGILVCIMLQSFLISSSHNEIKALKEKVDYLEKQQSSMIHWNFLKNMIWLQNQEILEELQNVEN